MQNVRNRNMGIETTYFGIKFRVWENALWRMGGERQSQTQIADPHGESRHGESP